MHRDRSLLLHFLAAIAYRTQKSLRDAPPSFATFAAGNQARTPVEILRHMTSLMGYVRTFFLGGTYPHRPDPLPAFTDEIARFHAMLEEVGTLLTSDTPLRGLTTGQLLHGPLADTMTHVGQLALLRRLADSPVPPENFIHAEIRPDRLGSDQALPAEPDADWPERPARVDAAESPGDLAVRLGKEFFEQVWGGAGSDLAAIDEIMTPDYCITTAGTTIRGREAFKQWVRRFRDLLHDARNEILESFATASGDRVVSRWICRGRSNGIFGLPPDGRPVAFTGIAIWRVRDGRLAECWVERAALEARNAPPSAPTPSPRS